MNCTHDVTDKEVAAVADGLCPICLGEENKRLREALEAIEDVCDGEIKARGFNEEKDNKSVVLSLLRMPRNIARKGLGGK